jgi:hypothetical protein
MNFHKMNIFTIQLHADDHIKIPCMSNLNYLRITKKTEMKTTGIIIGQSCCRNTMVW